MKYKVNWTELVGYYAIIEASNPDEAREIFEHGPDDHAPEPCGFCEVEQDSIEVEEYFDGDEQLAELRFKLRTVLPNAEITRDEGGQIVVYTGLQETEHGRLVEYEDNES